MKAFPLDLSDCLFILGLISTGIGLFFVYTPGLFLIILGVTLINLGITSAILGKTPKNGK